MTPETGLENLATRIEDAETVWRDACKAYAESPDVDVPWDDVAATKVISSALEKARVEERARLAERIRLYAVHLVKDQEVALLSAAGMIERGGL